MACQLVLLSLLPHGLMCLRDMLKYTASVREWMSADPQNIIAIHCKGGKGDDKDHSLFLYDSVYYLSWTKTFVWCADVKKVHLLFSVYSLLTIMPLLPFKGRTGTMVCTWLIDSDQFESAQVCLFDLVQAKVNK